MRPANRVDGIDLHRDLHFPHTRERVDEDRDVVSLGVLEQQCWAVPLDSAVGNFGDLEDRVTSAVMRFSSPFFSRARMNSRRSV